MRLYALYKGDTFIDIGTYEELANKIGVSINTIRFYATKTWKKKSNCEGYIVISVEEDKEDD